MNVKQPSAKPLKSQCHSYEAYPINYAEKDRCFTSYSGGVALKGSLAAAHHLLATKAKKHQHVRVEDRTAFIQAIQEDIFLLNRTVFEIKANQVRNSFLSL